MRALSFTQPWATAVALRIKEWETRSWPTGFRGTVAIHAAKSFPKWARQFAADQRRILPSVDDLPLGAIIAVAELTECRQTETVAPLISQVELDFGDFAPGRFCFKLDLVRKLRNPVPARGALGLWEMSRELVIAVAEQIPALP